jgi:hypothetical protein
MRRNAFLSLSILATVISSPSTRADTIVVVPSVSDSLGTYTYSYEIQNPTSIGVLLFSLSVTGDIEAVAAPNGWITTTESLAPGETELEWISTDFPFYVPALGTLSGFSFTSDSAPGVVDFSAFDEDFNEFDGQTTGPVESAVTAVPEPPSLLLVALSLLGICKRPIIYILGLGRFLKFAHRVSIRPSHS